MKVGKGWLIELDFRNKPDRTHLSKGTGCLVSSILSLLLKIYVAVCARDWRWRHLDGCSMVSGHAGVEWSWQILMSSWATLPTRDIKPSASTVPASLCTFGAPRNVTNRSPVCHRTVRHRLWPLLIYFRSATWGISSTAKDD